MLKKILSIIVISSLLLHCSSRLGVISYIYKSRHDIAQALGIIKEKPIAICDSNYFFQKDLKIQDDHKDKAISFPQAQEINLFCPVYKLLCLELVAVQLTAAKSTYLVQAYSSFTSTVFHPPSIV